MSVLGPDSTAVSVIRVALDASCTAKRERTGVARYAVCLIDAMLQVASDDTFVLGFRASRVKRHRFRYRPDAANARVRYFVDRGLRWWLGRPDVFHGLDARLPRARGFPAVVTLHDVAPAEHADIATAGFREKKLAAYEWIAERADRIICVSAATRDAFRRRFDVPADRFDVIHHGLEERFRPASADRVRAVLEPLGIARPYALFVGLLSARKNLTPLIRAFDQVAADVPDLALVLAGGRGHGAEDVDRAIDAARHRDRIIRPGFVSDDALPLLYAGARAFVLPSRNEGFGIPILEAMACRAPVIAADVPVAREVAGDAARLVDPDDDAALAGALADLAASEDAPERTARIERGAALAARYSWRAAATKTLAAYRRAIESHGSGNTT